MAAGTSSVNKGNFQPESDVHISYDDQQKINKFARLHAKLEDFKEEIEIKEIKLQNIKDAADEFVLVDESEKIPYLFNEIFIYQTFEEAQTSLEDAKVKIKAEIDELKKKCSGVKEAMNELKTHLYGKFGNQINLEVEDE